MTEQRSPDLDYWRIEGFKFDLFRCTTWRATLSIPACAGRWREAQTAKAERAEQLRLCRQCPTGAAHAGEKFIHRATVYGNNVCPRCRRGTTRRMVSNRVCLTCYNRQREVLVGKNAKGSAPLKAQGELSLVRIGVRLDVGLPTERIVEFADIGTGAPELRYHVERTHQGEVEFCDAGELGAYPSWAPAPIKGRTVLGSVAAASQVLAKAAEDGVTIDNWRHMVEHSRDQQRTATG